jgi:hypothetical protein
MDNKNITSVSMTTYITFSIVFFVVCLFNNWSVEMYLVMFLVFTFVLQLSMNVWASGKLCNKDPKKKEIDIGKSLGYTIVPWILIMLLVSAILYMMPGWVRVFSNTIGLAIVKSTYPDLFSLKEESTPASTNTSESSSETVQNTEVNQSPVPKELIAEIYHDPSKLINEVEYVPDFDEWLDTELKFIRTLPYFKNKEFDPENGLYTEEKDDDGKNKINKTHAAYQLYMCIATKEKIGYFIWLFLSGTIFVLTSLSQMYEADC